MTDRTGGVRAAFADIDIAKPANAFAYGLAMGQAIERERQEREDDAFHRATVGRAVAIIERADRRAHADRPGPRPGDYIGRERR